MLFVGETLGIPLHVFGPETHMTSIVGMALGMESLPGKDKSEPHPHTTANFLLPDEADNSVSCYTSLELSSLNHLTRSWIKYPPVNT